MRPRFLPAVLSLALLACSPLFSQKSIALTQAEYDQIILNMMTAQKALTESDSALKTQEAELQTLRTQLQTQSAYCAKLRQGQKNKLVITGALCFCLGVVSSSALIGALSP